MRLTPLIYNTAQYEVTISDPSTRQKSWTLMVPMHRSSEAIYEYACHEGNEGLPGALSGYR